MDTQNHKTIFVGVSGGVDSSVSLALLQSQGYTVVGVFIRTWQPEWITCTWKEERADAMRVCAHLKVPFVELDLEHEYKTGVADYMVREYKKGRTPNPDVMCNREVKFGAFLTWALSQGADAIATGHYAQTLRDASTQKVHLLRGHDDKKDQSYFLWTLAQEQLGHIIFPVGGMEKSKVRKLAERYQLPNAHKKDSQGICFIGEINMKDFLAHYIDHQAGDVVNTEGTVIGSHTGSLFFTIGERHGFVINREHKGTDDTPYYVVDKNIDTNTLVVSKDPQKYPTARSTHVFLENVVDNQGIFTDDMKLEAQIRYRGESQKIRIKKYDITSARMEIVFELPDYSLAPGQSVVLYHGQECLGGGIIGEE